MKEGVYKAACQIKMTYDTKATLIKLAVKQGKTSEQLATELFHKALKKVAGDAK